MFVFFNFGEKMSNQFSIFDNTIYQSEWYAFPDDVQKMLPIIMMGAQQSVILKGSPVPEMLSKS